MGIQWRKSNPICPVCGILVVDHSEQLAYDHEAFIHDRLQEAHHVVSILQESRTALSGQCVVMRTKNRRRLANDESRQRI